LGTATNSIEIGPICCLKLFIMARVARIVIPGYPHHVVQRGNRGFDVFFNDPDREAYLEYIRKASDKYGVSIWAWCLMSNHVHFIAVPETESSLGKCFADAHVRYARRINAREEWRGHLWQGRFGSNLLDENHLIAAVRYVERNPVRAGMVREPGLYRWSSAPWHLGWVKKDPLVKKDDMVKELVGDWGGYLQDIDEKNFLITIRRECYKNRPLGDEGFVKGIEGRFNLRLRREKAGRPQKKIIGGCPQ
jgi:REP-associated tyrosine transposase